MSARAWAVSAKPGTCLSASCSIASAWLKSPAWAKRRASAINRRASACRTSARALASFRFRGGPGGLAGEAPRGVGHQAIGGGEVAGDDGAINRGGEGRALGVIGRRCRCGRRRRRGGRGRGRRGGGGSLE